MSASTLSFCAVTTPEMSSTKDSHSGHFMRTLRSTKSAKVLSLAASLTMPSLVSDEILKPVACLLGSFMKLPTKRMKPNTLSSETESRSEFDTLTTSRSFTLISSYSGSYVRVSISARILAFQ
jgi:hypothetical protein